MKINNNLNFSCINTKPIKKNQAIANNISTSSQRCI